MKTLYTKLDIWEMMNYDKKSLEEIQEKMGFTDIGQGYGYKCEEAFILGKLDENYADVYICYIPEYCYTDDKINLVSCYTYQDIKDLCYLTKYSATEVFESLDWQHPFSLINDWDSLNL